MDDQPQSPDRIAGLLRETARRCSEASTHYDRDEVLKAMDRASSALEALKQAMRLVWIHHHPLIEQRLESTLDPVLLARITEEAEEADERGLAPRQGRLEVDGGDR